MEIAFEPDQVALGVEMLHCCAKTSSVADGIVLPMPHVVGHPTVEAPHHTEANGAILGSIFP